MLNIDFLKRECTIIREVFLQFAFILETGISLQRCMLHEDTLYTLYCLLFVCLFAFVVGFCFVFC